MATTYYAKPVLQTEPHVPETIERWLVNWSAPVELAAGDLVYFLHIPANKRVCGGKISISAGGHAATATLGDGTTADLFGSLTDMTGATVQYFAQTPATGLGNVSTAERHLVMTTADAAIDIDTSFYVYLDVE